MSTFAFAPLSRTLPYWPKELFGDPGGLLDEIGITDFNIVSDDDSLKFNGTVAWLEEIEFKLPGLDSVSIAFLSTDGFTQIPFELQVEPAFELTLVSLKAALRLRSQFLRPVQQGSDGKWVPILDSQGQLVPAEITLSGVNLVVSAEGDVSVTGGPALSLKPVEFGESGIVLEMSDINLYLSGQQTPPAGAQAGFKGLAINNATLHLSGGLAAGKPEQFIFTDLLIGSSGFSGKIEAKWTSTKYNTGSGKFDGSGGGTLFGLEFGLTSLDFTFVQNVPTDATLKGAIKLPFFDQPVDVDISVGADSSLSVALSPSVASASGLITFEKSDALRAELDSLGFELKDGLFTVKLSGLLTPLVADINWPSFDVRELSIDSRGHLHLDGGWLPLPTSYSIDLFKVATLEITKFGMGKTDDGGKYIGMSGGVELIKGLSAGASVEGLRVTWYDDGRPTAVSFNGIGISFETPALEFDGHVSYNGDTHQFKGDLTLTISACDLTLIGKAVFGVDKTGSKYFAIYVEGEFGTGIPLFTTGLSLYGFAGLLAVNYAPDKPETMLWYSVDKPKSWFHKPDKGVIDIIKKWKPGPGTFAIGAGVALGTGSDDGHCFNGKFFFLLLLPGPVLMIDGSAAFLRGRDDKSEPPFHGLIVLDNRAGYFLIGLDARWKSDKTGGKLADISGSMEVFFNYHDPTKWHLWLGKKDPMDQRIQARIASVFTANTYFMLDAQRLALGVWIGTSDHYHWGPVKAAMEAWLEANAYVNFKPPQFHVDINLHGSLSVEVFSFRLGIGLDALLVTDIFKPFHILGEIHITIQTTFKDFDVTAKLEWGPHHDPPDLHLPEMSPVRGWGILHPKSSMEWPLSGPKALTNPVVPVDCRPYFTFGYPMSDAISVGVNPDGDVWTTIGDPVTGAGSARVKYSLTKIELYRNGDLIADCPNSKSPNKIYGAWEISIPDTSTGKPNASGGQNKLLLWAKNPLDFADKAGSWNPWLSSNLPGYPCPTEKLETVCVDFQEFDLDRQLYGVWPDPGKPDFQFNWSDDRPHPIVPVKPAIEEIDRGLFFPAPTLRKHYSTYVSNFGDNTVSLVDLVTRSVVAVIPAGAHPMQVVLSPDGLRAYVCNRDDNTLIAIDTATNQRLGAPLGVVNAPDSIAITRDGKRAFVPSGGSPLMSVIDLQNFQVAATLNLPAAANQAVLTPDGNKLYVVHSDAGGISVFNTATLTLVKTVSVSNVTVTSLFNTGVDSNGATLANGAADPHYTLVSNLPGSVAKTFVTLDDRDPFPAWAANTPGTSKWIGPVADQNHVQLPTGDYDYRITFTVLGDVAAATVINGRWMSDDVGRILLNGSSFGVSGGSPNRSFVQFMGFSLTGFMNGVNTLDFIVNNAVVSATGLRVEFTNVSAFGAIMPGKMVIHPSEARAWVSFPNPGTVRLFDTSRDELTALETLTGQGARDLALSMDGARLYAGNLAVDTISVLDTAALDVLATVATPGPVGLQITPDGAALLAANFFTNTIAIIDPYQNQVVAPNIPAGQSSDSFAVMEVPPQMLYRAFVANYGSNSVSLLDLQTGNLLASIPVGSHPRCVAITPDLKRICVCSEDDGTFQVFDAGTYSSLGAPIPIVQAPVWIVISPDGRKAFVPSGSESKMSVIDLATLQVSATVTLSAVAVSVVLSVDGQKGYVMHGPASSVSVFSTSSLAITKVVAAPSNPHYMAVHPTLPRAFVSFPTEGKVREFDTNTEQFTGVAVETGAYTQNLCFSPNGSRLYACNLNGDSVSVIDTAANQVTATIQVAGGPWSPAITRDGSLLFVTNYHGAAVTMIDTATNRVLGAPIPAQTSPNSLVVIGVPKQGEPSLVPVEVTIDVPPGSSSVEVTWTGTGPLHGTVSKPSTQMTEVVASNGGTMKFDAVTAHLPDDGIDQIRLHSDSEWTLIQVCVTKLPFVGGLAEQKKLKDALNQQVVLWKQPTFLLDPGQDYEYRLDWSAEVTGLNALSDWSESFSSAPPSLPPEFQTTVLKFHTAFPPSLGDVSDPNVPPKKPPEGTGLSDLSLYVLRTIPVTETPKGRVPELTKPVFCGYDVTVEFNESYVDQMYQGAGRDLDLLLFDRNNQPVRDAGGALIIMEDAWQNATKVVLTETQARWIDMFNANKCSLTPIDPKLMPTTKMVLSANDAHVLAADTVYEARLVPQLMHQDTIQGWTTDPAAPGLQIWNPPVPASPVLPPWTDYRISVLVTLYTTDTVGILFRYTNGSFYEFRIDPSTNRRRLLRSDLATALAEDYFTYRTNKPYHIHIEAVGTQLLVSQEGVVVFSVTDATIPKGDPVLPSGTVALRPPTGQTAFQKFGVSDLTRNAPVAYRFHFTTSKFANFYHQIHSFQDELWRASLTTSQVSGLISNAVIVTARPLLAASDAEIRAYDQVASLVLGQASAQDPPQVEVTRVEDGATLLGWLLRSPEPIDSRRLRIVVQAAQRTVAGGQAPGGVKIAEAEFGDPESVTVLARERTDFSGYSIEHLQMPGALDEEDSRRSLWRSAPALGSATVGVIAGDSSWTDYRASAACRSTQPEQIGLLFRVVDAQNYYKFTLECHTGWQRIVKVVPGFERVLAQAPGDPALGIEVALAVSVKGSEIVAYRDGKKVLNYSDSNFPFTAGGAAVFASGVNSTARFGNFDVHLLPKESFARFRGAASVAGITVWDATDLFGTSFKALSTSSFADVVLQACVRRDSSGTAGLLLRYTDKDNHYRLLFTDTDLRLERVQSGGATPLWQGPPLAVDHFCDITVSLEGGAIRVFRDSVLACEVTDGAFAAGGIGICTSLVPIIIIQAQQAQQGQVSALGVPVGPAPAIGPPQPTLAQLRIANLVVYPPALEFSGWSLEDHFSQSSTDGWSFVDEGDQNGPSQWQVANGRLLQTGNIGDSSPDPVRKKGTLALLKTSVGGSFRCVARLNSLLGAAIGMVFGYRDSANFYRFSMDANAGYRRLVRCVAGNIKLLWQDSGPAAAGHDYVFTLDVTGDYVAGWLDGGPLFRWAVSEAVQGSIGFYCSGNPGASFGPIQIGTPSWIPYYTFSSEAPLSPGNRIKIASVPGAFVPKARTSIRSAADLDDVPSQHLPAAGAQLRLVTPGHTVMHRKECISADEFVNVRVKILRAADGTGIFLAPLSGVDPSQPVRFLLTYRRDNQTAEPGSVVFTEVGEPLDEVVSIDLPSDGVYTSSGRRFRIPQIVDGDTWKTTIVLVNADSVSAPFTVTFHQADGTPLSLPVAGVGAVTEYSGVIPVGGSRSMETQGQAANLVQGWAEISAASSIAGTATIRLRLAPGADAEGAVVLGSDSGKRFLLPFDNSPGFVTAMALLNSDPTQTAIVSVDLRDENGQPISKGSLTLDPKARQAFALNAQFPAVANMRGIAEFSSSTGELMALGLQFNPTGDFTSIAPIAADAPSASGTNSAIPQIVDGGGWQTTIVLVNMGSVPATITVASIQPDGSEWGLEIAGRGGVARYTDVIPVGGSRRIETSGLAANLSQGWAQVDTLGSTIAGFAILRQRLGANRDSVCSVPLNFARMRRFVLPFDNTQGFTTAVALANQDPSQSAVVTVILKDPNGQTVGNETLNLGPLARSAFTLPAQFPKTTNAQGVAEFSAVNVDLAAIGLRFNNPSGSFTFIRPIERK